MSFAEACTVFDDSLAKVFHDSVHSEAEAREIIIGNSLTGTLLLVSFIERMPDRVRITVRAKQPEWRRAIMKKLTKVIAGAPDDALDKEFRFDYATAKPNRFAGRARVQPVVVVLAPDVAKVFKDGESVNAVLRSIMNALSRKGDVD